MNFIIWLSISAFILISLVGVMTYFEDYPKEVVRTGTDPPEEPDIHVKKEPLDSGLSLVRTIKEK